MGWDGMGWDGMGWDGMGGERERDGKRDGDMGWREAPPWTETACSGVSPFPYVDFGQVREVAAAVELATEHAVERLVRITALGKHRLEQLGRHPPDRARV